MGEAQEKIRLAKEREARAEEEPFRQSRGGGKNAARPPVAIAAMRQEMAGGKGTGLACSFCGSLVNGLPVLRAGCQLGEDEGRYLQPW